MICGNCVSDQRPIALRAVAEETGATPNQVILAWMMQGDPAILPLIAASNSRQLQENLEALAIRLSVEQMDRLNGVGG